MRLVFVTEKPETFRTTPPGQKIVYLIRHGQSLANVSEDGHYRDAALTDLGKTQARALQSVVPQLNVELVVVSPLTRAIQTACLAFEEISIPMMIWPHVTEFFTEHISCRGRTKQELKSCSSFTSLSKFQDLDISSLDDDWWSIGDDFTRLHEFRRWLSHCPESRIAVVCHWGFIFHLLERNKFVGDLELPNCTYVETLWTAEPVSFQEHKTLISMQLVPSSGDNELIRQLLGFLRECKRDPILKAHTTSGLSIDSLVLPIGQPFLCDDADTFEIISQSLFSDLCAESSIDSAQFKIVSAIDTVRMSLTFESQVLSRFQAEALKLIAPVYRSLVRLSFTSYFLLQHGHESELVSARLLEIASLFPLFRQPHSASDISRLFSEIKWKLQVVRQANDAQLD